MISVRPPLLGLLLLALPPWAPAADYDHDIKPLLKNRCFSCHGPLKQKAGLRLDAGKLILKGSRDHAVIIPGQPGSSLLIDRITSADKDERMPPEGAALSPEEIAMLATWIGGGARFPAGEPALDSPQDHWAFQPLQPVAIPEVGSDPPSRNPIDRFTLARLQEEGWHPAPRADPGVLLRRVFLDLTGLPPTPDEQQSFARAPDLDTTIDDLLSRSSYGERWARHWLDVVRYADSNGYERDAAKPFVWRYRDYVIDSLNHDKPYDRFIIEQLAGDELPDASSESIIATSYLRLGHWDDEPADPATDRYDQLDDILSTTSQAMLGITLGCARCHDHKFEPLTHSDYYSMLAVFSPLVRPQQGRTELAVVAGSGRERAALQQRDIAITKIESTMAQLRAAAEGPIPDGLRHRLEGHAAEIAQLREAYPDLPLAYVWEEPGRVATPTRVLVRGNPGNPGELVEPRPPEILTGGAPSPFPPPDDYDTTTRRRLGLARWIASAENPLTARVIVNRVWMHHFGEGLVRTPSDFGLTGERPTHPELLDWLAHWFANDAHWSLKALHRLILTSDTWQMASRADNPAAAAGDPENLLLWRQNYHRLEVEAIRDSILAVSGRLNREMHGPQTYPSIPQQALEGNSDPGAIWKPLDEDSASRRTIYAFAKRSLMIPMLEVLDICDSTQSSPGRRVTTVAPQALTLYNGEFANRQARHFAARLRSAAGDDRAGQIDLAYRLALCRPPGRTETAGMLEFLEVEPLEQLCRVIFNLNEFVYPD